MNKFFVFLLIGIFSFQLSLGQRSEIIARLDLGKKDPKPDFYEYSPVDEGLVTLGPTSRVSSRYIGITKYDRNLKREWNQRVLEQSDRKNIDFVSVIGRYIFVFVSEKFPKEGVIKTYYYCYDLDGNELADQTILSVYPDEREQKVELQFVLSPDKRKLLCYKNLENRRDVEQVLYYLFDDEGDYVQGGDITLRYPDNRFRIRTVRVSNSGNIFLLGRFDLARRIRDLDDVKYMVYRYDINTQEGREIEIALGNKFITDLAFRLDRDENIYVAGFYSANSTYQIIGTLFQKIGPNGGILLNSSERFSEEFLSNYLSSGQINKGKELKNFYLDSQDGIILRSDGGVLLIAEKFYVTSQPFRDVYGYWVDREIYHYEDVILTSVSGDGNIEWHAIVDKNQVGESPATLSYFNAIGSTGTFIFYEDRLRRRNANVFYNAIAIDGQVSERTALFGDYKFDNEFYPRFCEQVNNQEAIMVYYQGRGKKLSVVKVRFDT